MTLKEAINRSRISYRELGDRVGMSASALSRLVNYGEYPARRDIEQTKQAIGAALSAYGIAAIDFPRPGLRPNYGAGARREASLGIALERHAEIKQLTKEDI